MEYIDYGGGSVPFRRELDLDIVTVHGLLQSSKSPFEDDDSGSKWLDRKLLEGLKYRLMAFTYRKTIEQSRIHTSTGLQDAAQDLLDSTLKCRSEAAEVTRPLAFVSHDMGGIILKRAMILAAQNQEKYGNVLRETFTMVFLGCPHRVSDGDCFMDQIARWLHNHEHLTQDGLLNTTRSWLSNILEINGLFLECGMLLRSRIVNVFSRHSEFHEQVFPAFTTTLGMPGEVSLSSTQPLATLLSGDEERTAIQGIRNILSAKKKGGRLSTRVLKELHSQLSLTPPTYPDREDSSLEWFRADHKLARWIDGSGPRFLHLVQPAPEAGSPGSLLRFIKEKTGQSVRTSHVFCFRFRQHDVRFRLTRALLTTFIAQATAEMPDFVSDDSVSQILEDVGSMKPLPEPDLFYLAACVCRAIRIHNGQAFWVIWNLDACSDSPSLVKSLANLDAFGEFPCRVLLQSSGVCAVTDSMKAAVVTVENEVTPPTSGSNKLPSPKLGWLTRDYPALSRFADSVQAVLFQHLQNNIFDTVFAQWTCNYVMAAAARSPPEIITGYLERLLNMTGQQYFMNIISTSIPPAKLPWAKRMLSWVKNSLRPLTIKELEDAIGPEKPDPQSVAHLGISDLASELRDCFAGLLIVENNEVLFIHPKVREYLSHSECTSQDWYLTARDAHLDILGSLLRRLSRGDEGVLAPPEPARRGHLSHPVPSRFDLRSYAAEFWLHHYREVKRSGRELSECKASIKAFLGNPTGVRSWASITGIEQPPETPGAQNPRGAPFPQRVVMTLAARIGLERADFDFLCPGWQAHPDLVLIALSEGVRNSHLRLVEELETPPLDEKNLEGLTGVASCCADAEVFKALLNKIQGRTEFPPPFLKRAARLGVNQILQQVLGNSTSGQDAAQDSTSSSVDDLIIEAIRFQQSETIEFLVKRLAPRTPTPGVLETACQVGNPRDLTRLLGGGFDMAALCRPTFEKLLRVACACGNPDIAELLIRGIPVDAASEMETLWSSLESVVSNGLPGCTAHLLERIELSEKTPESVRRRLWGVLMAGVGGGHVDACRLVLDKGADPNYESSYEGDVVLCHAFEPGKIPMIALLLDKGVAIEGANGYGCTALYKACGRGLTEIVSYLLERGANVDKRANFGGTALYQACMQNHRDVVEALLRKGANVRLSTHMKNWSPLEAAFNFPDILELLVEKRPDYRRVSGGTTALWRTARGGFDRSAEILLRRGDPDIEFAPKGYNEENDGLTPLAMAAKGGHHKVARLLLEAGANVNFVTPGGDFILKFAKNEETLAVLLEYNPDLKLVDGEENAAIHAIVSRSPGDLAAVKRLVNASADIQAPNKAGETPLTLAVAGGDMDVIKYLVSKGASTDAPRARAGGALYLACKQGSLELVKFLAEKGANVGSAHGVVGTPLSCVCTSDEEQFDKMKYLVGECRAEITVKAGWHGHVLNEACLRCDVDTVQYLINNGGRSLLSEADHLGRAPAFYACYRGQDPVDMVRYLISLGADVSAKVRDKMGRTVLHCAVATRNPDLVKLLLEYDNELIHAADTDGWTPLHWATRTAYSPVTNSATWSSRSTSDKRSSEMVRLLLGDGAGGLIVPGKAAGREWSPLKLAKYHQVDGVLKDQLTPESLQNSKGEPVENTGLFESGVAVSHGRMCRACFCETRGIYYRCANAACFGDYDLCFKCIDYSKMAHDAGHDFGKAEVPEFESGSTEDSRPFPFPTDRPIGRNHRRRRIQMLWDINFDDL